jgi:TolB-like protein/Tfp pilus assembly protein PilF
MKLFLELKRRNVFRVATAYTLLAWLGIQVADTILPAFGFADTVVRFATIIAIIGIVPVLIFSWVFELTPDGFKKDSDVNQADTITPQTGRILDRIIIVVLAVALTYFSFDKFILTPAHEAALAEQRAVKLDEAHQAGRTQALVESFGDNSIAVLPFVNMSADPEQEYFSDGISEELLNLLAKIPEMRVISRTSAFAFKGKEINIVELSEKLNVAHVLEGSVRKSGDHIRITAQLIEARSDTHLWSETYDRKFEDVFAIQDEIAKMVVNQLKLEILGEAPVSTTVNPDAYALFLEARHLSRSANAETLEKAKNLYQQALDIDPNFVAAWDRLAALYDDQVAMRIIPTDEGSELSRLANERALQLNPNFAPAHATLAYSAIYYENDYSAAARHIERAQELAPKDVSTLGMAAILLHNLGRTREAVLINQYVINLDPLNRSIRHNTSIMLYCLGRFDEAINSFRILLRLSPDQLGTHYFIGLAQLYKGEPQAALNEFNQESYQPLVAAGKAMAFHALGRIDEYEAALNELIERWQVKSPTAIARVYAFAAQIDSAFYWLDKAIEANMGGQINPIDPGFVVLHDDPRWDEFLQQINKVPAELAAIEFKAQLPI